MELTQQQKKSYEKYIAFVFHRLRLNAEKFAKNGIQKTEEQLWYYTLQNIGKDAKQQGLGSMIGVGVGAKLSVLRQKIKRGLN